VAGEDTGVSKVDIHDLSGSVVGQLDLNDPLILDAAPGQVVHEAVVAYRANNRAGTASTLRKGEVKGSNRKPWRQKGTGRARAGYRQSPVWRGGSVAFGPHPRKFTKKVNKKAGRAAFRQALSVKLREGEVRVIQDLNLEEGKTKALVAVLNALKIEGAALFVVEKMEKNALLAARNIPNVELVTADAVSTYELVRYPAVVITKDAFQRLETRVKGGAAKVA
jgi:large subunit ribosomal protein L4